MATSSSWLRLAHKTAIVTGAGSGIGKAVATSLLLDHDCRVVLVDRNYEALTNIETEILTSAFTRKRKLDVATNHSCVGTFIKLVECDVTDSNKVKELIETADQFATTSLVENLAEQSEQQQQQQQREEAPNPRAAELLVNCAGITRDDFIGRMSEQDYDDVLDVNLKATFLLCRHFCDEGRIQRLFPITSTTTTTEDSESSSDDVRRYGSIVNVGSVVSELGNIGQTNYAASKGGVLGMTRALAKEMAYRNIRANSVVPGFIDTPMANAVPDHIKERIVQGIALKRFGAPSEVADMVAFLLSPRSSYITGESIRVSGMISL